MSALKVTTLLVILLKGSMIELWGNNADSLSGWISVYNTRASVITNGNICHVSDTCFRIMGRYIGSSSDDDDDDDGGTESCTIYIDTISTLGYNNIQLKFYAKSINNGLNGCKARYKMGTGSWYSVWNGNGMFGDSIVINIGNNVNDNSKMLFIRFENNDASNPCYIDNIRIYGTSIITNVP